EQDLRVIDELQQMGFGSADGSKGRPIMIVLNKSDRPEHLNLAEIAGIWPGASIQATSVLTGMGLVELEQALADLILGDATLQNESVLVTSTRHQEALRRAAEHLQASLSPLEQGLPLDFVSIDLRAAYESLGEITGETAGEDLLDRIFREFCIGK
ncbi:MAG TPA: hypothetical protein VFN23_18915, partial [Ktedonobacteraceae bacterium]|nr:hypothetical protein [Ktedonobacteraceae bacterium]